MAQHRSYEAKNLPVDQQQLLKILNPDFDYGMIQAKKRFIEIKKKHQKRSIMTKNEVDFMKK